MLPSRRIAFSLLLIATVASAQPARRRVGSLPPPLPVVSHVFLVILENEDESRAIQQPFLAELASRGATLKNYRGLAHPSQPNYIALVTGSTHGIMHNDLVTIDVRHLGDLLEERGLTWRTYAENYPGNCYLGVAAGSPSSGQYVRRHVPFLNFANVQTNRQRSIHRVVKAPVPDADTATRALPSYAFEVPNNPKN